MNNMFKTSQIAGFMVWGIHLQATEQSIWINVVELLIILVIIMIIEHNDHKPIILIDQKFFIIPACVVVAMQRHQIIYYDVTYSQ